MSRRIAAILFTDMVGYTASVQRNEAQALQVLRHQQRLVRSVLPGYGGREIKTIGDAFLVVFDNALHACECAIALQQAVQGACAALPPAERFQLRMGLHLGDVEYSRGDVYGDSVNIAARLQTQSPPGGLALSAQVHEQVRNKLPAAFSCRGEVPLKNIEHAPTVFVLEAAAIGALPPMIEKPGLRHGRHDRWHAFAASVAVLALMTTAAYWGWMQKTKVPPAVAVLPFDNLSSEPEAAHFVAGMHDTLLTQLAQLDGLKVIARASVMEYRTDARDLPAIGAALKAAHLVEGSVQRQADRLRINVRLSEAHSARPLWAETYDRDVADAFDIQSDLARNIARAVHAVLSPAESERLDVAPTSSSAAYDLYLQAIALQRQDRYSQQGLARSRRLLEQALRLDPAFAHALAALARLRIYDLDAGFVSSPDQLREAEHLAAQALKLRPGLAEAHWALALYHYYGLLDFDRALSELNQALLSQPRSAEMLADRAFVLRRAGRAPEALRDLRQAVELDPRNPASLYELAATHAFLHQDAQAHSVCQSWFQSAPMIGDFRTQCLKFSVRHAASLAPARAAERDWPKGGSGAADLSWLRYELAMDEGRWSDALRALDALTDEDLTTWAGAPPRSMLQGEIARLQGDAARARHYFRQAEAVLRERLKPYEDLPAMITNQAFVRALLGRVLAERGRADEALAQAELVRGLLPETRDRFYGTSLSEEIARIHLRLGDADTALAELERLLSIPSHTHINDLRLQRSWAELRDLPRFQGLLQRHLPPTAADEKP